MKITIHPGAERELIQASFYEKEGPLALAANFGA